MTLIEINPNGRKMDAIPFDVMEAANAAWKLSAGAFDPVGPIARAILAERDRAVAACEAQKAVFASTEYATPQPLGGRMERFAVDRCIEAIRKGSTP